MIKDRELTDVNSCLNKAACDEPIFVLRANDELAPGVVLLWARNYYHLKGGEHMTPKQKSKWGEALALADKMILWKEAHP